MFDLLKYKNNIAVITDRNETLKYGQLVEEADKFHAIMPMNGLMFCMCDNLIGSFVGYVSCMYKKIPTVLLDANMDVEMLKQLISIYQPEYLWKPHLLNYDIQSKTIYSYMNYSLQHVTYQESKVEKRINPELLLCLTTSGSTGSPKLVRLSERNLYSNAISIANYLKIDSKERPVTSLPMNYSYGMSIINSHLIKGATILLTDKSVMQSEFWSFIKEKKASSIAGVPYTYEILKRIHFFSMNLPYLKTMTQAGGKLNNTLVNEFANFALNSGRQFIVMYGQTEAAPRMSYLPPEFVLKKSNSIGIPIPGGDFYIIDIDGNRINDSDVDGELVYTGANVCIGYAEKREDLQNGDENHGVLHTGDVARRDIDGYYYITGRIKRFLKVWGYRFNLDAIEQLVKNITPNCACVGVDDNISIFITELGLENQILKLLVQKTGLNPRAFTVKVIDDIPKFSSGKIDYPKLQSYINT